MRYLEACRAACRSWSTLRIAASAIALIGASVLPANALTYYYGAEFSGSGSTTNINPFAQADIVDIVGGVSVTISVYGGLQTGAYVAGAYFNYGGNDEAGKKAVGTLATAKTALGGTQSADAVNVSYNAHFADGGGAYDVLFSYPASNKDDNRFIAGENSSVTFALAGISAALFSSLAAPHGGNGTWYSVLDIRGLDNGSGSGWFASGPPGAPPPAIPLPGALVLFGTVLAGSLGIVKWRRRRGQQEALVKSGI